ncbi:MAG TPA: PfaD family polyunsaturated fatty acid/polyketide biosynthesis protein [Thermoflexia bacterium]|nr:PfaD family polyunsaturated fatty acid/polyketide biosynthesis protein [Thermoflexia bacterium]
MGKFDTVEQDALAGWQGPRGTITYALAEMQVKLRNLEQAYYVVKTDGGVGITDRGSLCLAQESQAKLVDILAPLPPQRFGDPAFRETYGLDYAYVAGSMANGISSTELVIALGREKLLAAFGSGGFSPAQITAAIRQIQAALPDGPYAFNLLHSPTEPALERQAVDLYLQYGVKVVEASAYLKLTPSIIRYRVAGLDVDARGRVIIRNRVLAKLSRREVATRFMRPPPEKLLRPLVAQGLITARQAELSKQVPMADDITVEADSGGHTDNRPLVGLLPSMLALRDEMQAEYQYETPVRVGAAGGIGTPQSALGAFMMGAAYIMTGSINQSCVEAGTSTWVKELLAQAQMPDVMLAPAADMFEMGVNVQVLKRGTLFPMRARKLYALYKNYQGLDEIPAAERERLEKRIFQRSWDAVWQECVAFFNERDPTQIEKARQNPRRKMALLFRWYLGQAAYWGISGAPARRMDYQIWCGPAMGAFNDWVRGTELEQPGKRHVVDVAQRIMNEAAYLYRVQALRMAGVYLPLG